MDNEGEMEKKLRDEAGNNQREMEKLRGEADNSEGGMEKLRDEAGVIQRLWHADNERWQVRLSILESEVAGLKSDLFSVEANAVKESVFLGRRMKTADTLLGYLKSKAKIMAIPRYARTSCGIKEQDGVGLIDKRGVPMAEWGNSANLQLFESATGKDKGVVSGLGAGEKSGAMERAGGDGEYVERMAMTVMQITEVMEVLLKRAIVAETEVTFERKRCLASQDEVLRKAGQIASMWTRVEEMERVAMGTSGVLKEMQLKLEDMEHETSKQKQRAAENEQELSRVRHDFGVLRSSVDNLVRARDTIRSLENRVLEVETVSERLAIRVLNLESAKKQREGAIAKLLLENDGLRGKLDLKEAELSAMGQQFRILAEQPMFS